LRLRTWQLRLSACLPCCIRARAWAPGAAGCQKLWAPQGPQQRRSQCRHV